MFTAAKDAIASRAAQAWTNSLINRYGQVQEVKIDSRLKTVEVTCLLEGETAPITLWIENYVVQSEGDKKFVRVTGLSCSRPWLEKLLKDYGLERAFELPSWAAAAL